MSIIHHNIISLKTVLLRGFLTLIYDEEKLRWGTPRTGSPEGRVTRGRGPPGKAYRTPCSARLVCPWPAMIT